MYTPGQKYKFTLKNQEKDFKKKTTKMRTKSPL